MRSLSLFVSALATMSLVDPLAAAPQTVTLDVSNMTCSVCPITVKKALLKVPGVSKVDVSYQRQEARVSFDDAEASIAELENATFEAGYPAKLKPAEK